MEICIIAQVEPSQHKGGGKAQYFLAKEWSRQGHSVRLLGADQLLTEFQSKGTQHAQLSEKEATTRFIEKNGAQYDIIDIDHGLLTDTPLHLPRTLIVGRSVLFAAHRFQITPPEKPKLKTRISRLLKRCLFRRGQTANESLHDLGRCLAQADLLNVTSKLDIAAAQSVGVPPSKVCRFPYALNQQTIDNLAQAIAPSSSDTPHIAFLGTFDYRKGCLDTVQCFRKLRIQFPTLKLSLIGAKGMHQTEKEVRSFFNTEENQHLSIYMTFAPDAIDELLARKHAAIFPSYFEGFPFAVQETLAAGIPTIAYDTPGAHDLLPPEWLVEAGDINDMCAKISVMIMQPDRARRDQAKSLIQQYNWQKISDETLKCYEAHLAQKKQQAAPLS